MRGAARLIVLVLSLTATRALALESVGYASSLRPSASQTAPGEAAHSIAWKEDIYRNASLSTSDKGALEVTFKDQSKLSMGPNSELTVDQFVYSGTSSGDQQILKYGKGAFRFVSGAVPKDKVKIQTPTATIGIRGTIVRTLVTPDGTTTVGVDHGMVFITSLLNGQMMQLSAGQRVTLRPGGQFGTIALGKVEGCD